MRSVRNRGISEGERLENEWAEIAEIDTLSGYDLDVEHMKHLIYDTYRYFWEKRPDDYISRSDLPIYKCIGQFIKFEYYPDNVPASSFHALADFACGLCVEIETGFIAGYLEESIILGCQNDMSPGFAHVEVDMSSYERFEEGFEKDRISFRDMYDETEE